VFVSTGTMATTFLLIQILLTTCGAPLSLLAKIEMVKDTSTSLFSVDGNK